MTCPLCNQQSSPIRVPDQDWTVCFRCGAILMLDVRVRDKDVAKVTGTGTRMREATPEEFLMLVEDTQAYGILLLMQDEILARKRDGTWV